ncbi:MAG: outer membrane beta-barrel protein [Taibaiella sp.]|nr:outer membrane beta-barrel protein [Taibaiella sp.]
MKRLYLLLSFIVCFVVQGMAQPYLIRGSVTDTLNAAKLPMASVVLIRSWDSVIEAHTRTNGAGQFEARVRKQGKYFFRVTFPGFADYIDNINVKKSVTDLGDLPMISKSLLLKEFVLTQQVSAIKIKGDTTEYMADSFKVKEGATVEDLLKKLPGIQVDKNGNVVAQGETVQKILVDGEEFFSDDPKVVMKGLQADAVKKVQVYDKKSDQADFTGIDDGQKTRTINLELKEDKKKGYFGKVDAGGGSDGYFQEQGMINSVRAKRQLAAFGVVSNTDKVGLGWRDNDKFGAGNGTTEITEDGAFVTNRNSTNDDFGGWDGKYNGEGFPRTWTGGAHYANKWDESKHHVAGNYRFARQDVNVDGTTQTQYNLTDSVRVSDTRRHQYSMGDRHGADFMYEWKVDSNTSVKVTSNAGVKQTSTYTRYETQNYFQAGTADSNTPKDTSLNDRTITSDGNAQFLNTDLLLRRKFSKKGRSLSLDVKENYNESKNTGILLSDIINPGIAVPRISINQKKENNTGTMAFSGKVTYTEPITKVMYAEVNAGSTVNNSTASNLSYDSSATAIGDKYSDVANPLFSTDYKYNIFTYSGGLNFKFVYEKINFSFGSDVNRAEYRQTDVLRGGTVTPYGFTNLFPKASFTYRVGRQTNFNINYRGNTTAPTIQQMLPFQVNNDPLNTVEGNPALRQSFSNTVAARFNDFKILQSRFLWANVSFTTVSNAITTEQTTRGSSINTKYINMDGNYNGYGFLGYGFKIGKSDFMVGAQLNGSVYHVNNMIDGIKNTNDNMAISFGPYLNYDKEDKFEFRWNPQISYNDNTSTNGRANTNYYIFNNDLNGSVQLPKKFEVGSSVDMMFRQKTPIFTSNNNVIKWNAYIEKKFLKKGQLATRFSVFDILNQNLGFSRNASGNIITQNSYGTIRRYAMLNVIWNFAHTPAGAPPPQGGGMRMMRK